MNKILQALFTSRVRLKLLEVFISRPAEKLYVRQLVRECSEEINAVRRELANFENIGLIRSEPRANRLYYFLRTDFLYYPELVRIVGKSTGLGYKIIKNTSSLGVIKYAMLAAAFLKGRIASEKEVDLLIVGKIKMSSLEVLIDEEEKRRNHAINYTVMTEDEFIFRKKRKDSFINEILSQTQVVLIGDEEELNKFE